MLSSGPPLFRLPGPDRSGVGPEYVAIWGDCAWVLRCLWGGAGGPRLLQVLVEQYAVGIEQLEALAGHILPVFPHDPDHQARQRALLSYLVSLPCRALLARTLVHCGYGSFVPYAGVLYHRWLALRRFRGGYPVIPRYLVPPSTLDPDPFSIFHQSQRIAAAPSLASEPTIYGPHQIPSTQSVPTEVQWRRHQRLLVLRRTLRFSRMLVQQRRACAVSKLQLHYAQIQSFRSHVYHTLDRATRIHREGVDDAPDGMDPDPVLSPPDRHVPGLVSSTAEGAAAVGRRGRGGCGSGGPPSWPGLPVWPCLASASSGPAYARTAACGLRDGLRNPELAVVAGPLSRVLPSPTSVLPYADAVLWTRERHGDAWVARTARRAARVLLWFTGARRRLARVPRQTPVLCGRAVTDIVPAGLACGALDAGYALLVRWFARLPELLGPRLMQRLTTFAPGLLRAVWACLVHAHIGVAPVHGSRLSRSLGPVGTLQPALLPPYSIDLDRARRYLAHWAPADQAATGGLASQLTPLNRLPFSPTLTPMATPTSAPTPASTPAVIPPSAPFSGKHVSYWDPGPASIAQLLPSTPNSRFPPRPVTTRRLPLGAAAEVYWVASTARVRARNRALLLDDFGVLLVLEWAETCRATGQRIRSCPSRSSLVAAAAAGSPPRPARASRRPQAVPLISPALTAFSPQLSALHPRPGALSGLDPFWLGGGAADSGGLPPTGPGRSPPMVWGWPRRGGLPGRTPLAKLRPLGPVAAPAQPILLEPVWQLLSLLNRRSAVRRGLQRGRGADPAPSHSAEVGWSFLEMVPHHPVVQAWARHLRSLGPFLPPARLEASQALFTALPWCLSRPGPPAALSRPHRAKIQAEDRGASHSPTLPPPSWPRPGLDRHTDDGSEAAPSSGSSSLSSEPTSSAPAPPVPARSLSLSPTPRLSPLRLDCLSDAGAAAVPDADEVPTKASKALGRDILGYTVLTTRKVIVPLRSPFGRRLRAPSPTADAGDPVTNPASPSVFSAVGPRPRPPTPPSPAAIAADPVRALRASLAHVRSCATRDPPANLMSFGDPDLWAAIQLDRWAAQTFRHPRSPGPVITTNAGNSAAGPSHPLYGAVARAIEGSPRRRMLRRVHPRVGWPQRPNPFHHPLHGHRDGGLARDPRTLQRGVVGPPGLRPSTHQPYRSLTWFLDIVGPNQKVPHSSRAKRPPPHPLAFGTFPIHARRAPKRPPRPVSASPRPPVALPRPPAANPLFLRLARRFLAPDPVVFRIWMRAQRLSRYPPVSGPLPVIPPRNPSRHVIPLTASLWRYLRQGTLTPTPAVRNRVFSLISMPATVPNPLHAPSLHTTSGTAEVPIPPSFLTFWKRFLTEAERHDDLTLLWVW